MKFEIKALNPNRWEEYKNIRLESLKNEPLAFGRAFEEEKDRKPTDWKDRLKREHPPVFALADNQVVGIASYSFEKGLKLLHIADIGGVYVKNEFRGNGISHKLLNHIFKKIMQNKKIKKIELHVTETQLPARKLYKNLGFREIGVFEKELFVKGKYYNSIAMEKLI